MKTQEQQIDFSEKLTELTNNYSRVVEKLKTITEDTDHIDKMSIFIEMKAATKALDDHRNSYIGE